MTNGKTAVEIAAEQLAEIEGKLKQKIQEMQTPLLVVPSLAERLATNARSAWAELDAIPIPQTTFYDANGLPAYTVLGDGTKLTPGKSAHGTAVEQEDAALGVDEKLQPLRVHGNVLWTGSVPDNWRSTELRSEEAERRIAAGYDDASSEVHVSGDERALTEHQQQIVVWLAEGKSVKTIAGLLGIAPVSVRSAVFRLKRKMGTNADVREVDWQALLREQAEAA